MISPKFPTLLRFAKAAVVVLVTSLLSAAEMPESKTTPLPPAPAPGDTGVWTLERALDRAMEANGELLAAKHEFERQEGIRIQLRARLLPSLALSGATSDRSQSLVDEAPSQRLVPPSKDTAVALSNYDARIEVRQLVFDGLSSWNQAKRQQLLTRQSYLTLYTTAIRTATQVRQGFDAIQMRASMLASEQRRVQDFEQLLKVTTRKQAVGEIPEFELLRVDAELQGARAELADAARALGQAEQAFRRLLQVVDNGQPLRLSGRFVPRDFKLPLDEAIQRAVANRPDLEGAALAVEAAKRNERAVKGRYLPRIEVFGSYGSRSSYYDAGNRLNGWTVGAQGQWSIFEGGAGRGQDAVVRAERRAAEDKLTDTRHQITSRLRDLYQGLQQAQVAMEAHARSVSLAARSSRDATKLYEAGQANLEQVLQTAVTFRRAESRHAEAIYIYNSLVADIEFSVGGRLGDSVPLTPRWKP
jgi:outer membrane protein